MGSDLVFLLNGILIGISVAAPVGAIGVLVIRRTLAHGRATGFITGLGVATADATYGIIAAFGLSAVSNILINAQPVIKLAGGLFLLYLGIRTFLSKPASEAAQAREGGRLGAYGSALFLTLTNPTTILMFAGIFAGAGLAASGGDVLRAALMVIGVFSGSCLWWLLLSTGVSLFRARFTPGVLLWVNRVSGVIIGAFGVVSLASLLG